METPEVRVAEPSKRVPVARRVDVVVAGSGVSGVFAALGAAKDGARALLIDRMCQLDGNMVPGYVIGSQRYTVSGRALRATEHAHVPVFRRESEVGFHPLRSTSLSLPNTCDEVGSF